VVKIGKMACLGAETRTVRTTEWMEECRACGTQVQWQLVNHPFWGFRSGCPRLTQDATAAAVAACLIRELKSGKIDRINIDTIRSACGNTRALEDRVLRLIVEKVG
jgi:hypothetical protein